MVWETSGTGCKRAVENSASVPGPLLQRTSDLSAGLPGSPGAFFGCRLSRNTAHMKQKHRYVRFYGNGTEIRYASHYKTGGEVGQNLKCYSWSSGIFLLHSQTGAGSSLTEWFSIFYLLYFRYSDSMDYFFIGRIPSTLSKHVLKNSFLKNIFIDIQGTHQSRGYSLLIDLRWNDKTVSISFPALYFKVKW